MKKKILLRWTCLLGALLVWLWPQTAIGQSQMLMPRFGKHTVEITNDTVVVDFLDETEFTGNNQATENSAACVQFKAADPNKRVVVSFEFVDMLQPTFGSSYKAFIKIYEGACDDECYTWPEAYGDVPLLLPGGGIDSLTGTYENLTYIAGSAEGLSIGFLYKYASRCKGFKATVSCVEDKAVAMTQAVSAYHYPTYLFAGTQNVNVLSYEWFGDGLSVNDSIKALTFEVEDDANILSVDNFKLYASPASILSLNPVEATVKTETDGSYTFELSYPVARGSQVLSIGADLSAASGVMGQQCRVKAKGIKTKLHADGIAGFTPAVEVPYIEIPHVVLMASGVKTVDIATKTLFYDDGGPENNITENFEGMVVLKPTTQGKVIQIDFTKIDLFNTNPDRNDILNIYNGSGAASIADLNAENLNIRLLKEKTARVRSMASDGSLTVYLKSTTGVTKSGFEAEISEYTPAAMRFVSANQYCDATQTGAQGDSLLLLGMKIMTDDILTPLTLQAMTLDFSAGNPVDIVAGGTIYYMGKDSVFNATTAQTIGHFERNGATAAVSLENFPVLTEGANYVYVKVGLTGAVKAGDKVSAYCSSLTLSGTAHTQAQPTLTAIVLDNIWYSKDGTKTKAYQNSIGLKPTPYSSYAYAPSMTSAQIVTFVPKGKAEDNRIVSQIDFSAFDLYQGSKWSSTAYGDHDVFKVYSGAGTAEANLLWEYKGGADAATAVGPGRILRSEAADGALTIEFQSKASYGSVCGKGFEAVVSDYVPAAIDIASATGFQADSGGVAKGTAKRLLLGMAVKVNGTLDHLNWTGAALRWKDGCHTVLDKADLYMTQTAEFDAAASPVATSTVASATTTFSGSYAMEEGTYWLWVTVDIKDNAKNGTQIDAEWTGLTTSLGSDYTVAMPDPEGELEIRAIYYMQDGENPDVPVDAEGVLMFYDDGGPTENYSAKKWNGKVTFVPPAGYIIRIEIKDLLTGGAGHKLAVYGSGTTDLAYRFGEYYKSQYTDQMPRPTDKLQSRTADGKLTVTFTTSTTTGYAGWVIEVRAVKPATHTIASLQAKALTPSFVGAYSASIPALDMTMPVNGDFGEAELNALTFDLTGTTADIRQLAVYYAGADTMLNLATAEDKLFAAANDIQAGTNSVTLQGKAVADWEQNYRLFALYSLGEAAPDAKVSLALSGAQTNEGAVEVQSETAQHTVMAGVHGEFLVGTSSDADYPTLQKAIDAIKGGVDGPVTIRIEDGEYSEAVVIPAIPGLSEQNPLHITSVSGDAEKVTLTAASFNEYSDYSTLTRNPNKGVLNMDGTAYVTLSHIGFTATNASKFDGLVYIYNGAHHITLSGIRGVREASLNYSTAFDHVQILYPSLNSPLVNCAYIKVENSYFEGGAMACEAAGTGMVGSVKNQSDCKAKYIEITGNTFVNQGDRPLYIHDVEDVRITGNTLQTNYVYSSQWYGMDLYRCGAPAEVSGNRIRAELPSGKYAYGINGRPLYGTADAPTYVFNNSVQILNTTGSTHGLRFTSGSETYGRNAYLNIAHNTVLLSSASSAASSTAVFIDNDALPEAVELTNNLFQNKAGGYVYRLQKADDAAAIAWNNNGIYTSGANYAYLAADVATAEAWQQAVPSDQNGVVAEAAFLNDEILGLKTLGSFNQSKPLAWVTTDIFGSERPASGATMGAYEFEDGLDDAPVMADGYPVIDRVTAYTADVQLKMNQSGIFYGYAYEPEATPVAADILANGRQANAGRMQTVTMRLQDLQDHHAYKACFVMKNYNDVQSATPVCSETFMTEFRPTAPSTFETVETGAYAEAFENGTASFSGFDVIACDEDAVGAPQGDHRALAVGEAEIRILNTDTGMNLTGFYYKSKQATALTLVNSSATSQLTLPASATWRYFGLRGKGRAHTLRLAATDSLWLDDFSGSPLALKVSALYSDTTVSKGEIIVLGAVAQGGVPDYTYRWQDGGGAEVAQTAEWSLTVERTAIYAIEVQDAWGNVATARVQVVAKGGDGIADFEGLLAKAESNWHGELNGTNRFYSGSFRFDNTYNAEYDAWNGYACANLSGNTYVPAMGYGNQYKNAVGGGADGSASYGLIYNRGVATYVGGEDGVQLQGVYVTNNTMLVNAVEEGDSWVGEPFGTGDYFKAIITGTSPDGEVKTMDYYLADYRDENPDEHYVLTTWEWVDLSALGTVKSLSVSFDGSRSNAYGLTLPAYMAVDNLNGGYRVDDYPYAVQVGTTRDLAFDGLFALQGRGRWQVEVLEAVSDATVATVAVTETNLRVTALKTGETNALLKARRNGQTVYVRLNVTVTEEPVPVDKPTFDPAGGEVEAGTAVRILCATSNAVIRYTVDGTEPDENSAIYTQPLVVNEAMTVKAFATMTDMLPSEVAEASYTIKAVVPVPDADLRSLTVSAGELSPAFSPDVYRYTVNVDSTVETITLTAVANDAAATVAGAGVHALKPGANALAVTVTAADGETTKTYRIVVTRALSGEPTIPPADTTANEADLQAILMSVYPNPTADVVYVEVTEAALLEVLDLNGHLLYHKAIGAGIHAITLEKSGIYFIRVSSGDRVSVKRVVRR